MRGKPLPDVRQHSFEGQFCQLAIGEGQAKAPAPDVSEPLNVIGDRFIIPLFDRRQVRDLHLMYSCEEVLVELLLQIGPCNDGFGGSEVNHTKADSERDSGNSRIPRASIVKHPHTRSGTS